MTADLLILGDVHGDLNFLERSMQRARLEGIKHIIQLGDFGIWSGSHGKLFREGVTSLTEQYDVKLDFLCGNHDNHETLRNLVDEFGWEHPIPMGGSLRYLPRGCRFQIGKTKFGALGGAFSIDMGRRIENVSWWRREMIENEDIERLGTDKLDVLLTHDSPELIENMALPLRQELEQKSEANRMAVRAAIRNTNPSLVIHGHWHTRVTYTHGWTELTDKNERGLIAHNPTIHGLGHNHGKFEDSWIKFSSTWASVVHFRTSA